MDPLKPDQPDTGGSEHDAERPQASPAEVARIQNHLLVQQRFERGAGWFSSVAVFSLVNTVLLHFGAGITFVGVLGFTKIVDILAIGLTEQLGPAIVVVAIVIDLIAAGFFFGLARWARQHKRWAFYVGMGLYVLDGLIMLALGDMIEVVFHAFILNGLMDGMRASRELQELAMLDPAGASPGAEGGPAA